MNEYLFTSLVTLGLVILGWLLANRVSKARLNFSQSDRSLCSIVGYSTQSS